MQLRMKKTLKLKFPQKVILVIVAQCVACGHRRDIQAGEVAPDELPMCDKCFSPMIAVSAAIAKAQGK